MKRLWLLVLALSLGVGGGLPPQAVGWGRPLQVDPYFCDLDKIDGTFTATTAGYRANGGCDVQVARVGFQRVGLTAVGGYDQATGRAKEEIVVPPATIDRPSHPYGTVRSLMTCSADPWLTENAGCHDISLNVDITLDREGGLDRSLKLYGRPFTANLLYTNRNTLNAKRKADVDALQLAEKAKHRSQTLERYASTPKTSMAAGATNTFSFPKILAPVGGQRFIERTPIPIKLEPPHGWTVGGYMVEVQREDKNGSWIAHATLPVAAYEAQQAGYTGFGAGAPPAGLSLPGSWRLRAQASSPKASGWSEWVPFTVGNNTRQQRH
jgi:hypothetical protein